MIVPARKRCRCSLALVTAVVVAAVTGCNSSAESLGVVSGKVTIDGQPAGSGTIAFVPSGQSFPSARSNIVDGNYEQQIPSGKYKVMISSHRVVSETKIYDSPDSPTRQVTEEILPVKYNDQTELEVELGSEATTYNFDLSSK